MSRRRPIKSFLGSITTTCGQRYVGIVPQVCSQSGMKTIPYMHSNYRLFVKCILISLAQLSIYVKSPLYIRWYSGLVRIQCKILRREGVHLLLKYIQIHHKNMGTNPPQQIIGPRFHIEDGIVWNFV